MTLPVSPTGLRKGTGRAVARANGLTAVRLPTDGLGIVDREWQVADELSSKVQLCGLTRALEMEVERTLWFG